MKRYLLFAAVSVVFFSSAVCSCAKSRDYEGRVIESESLEQTYSEVADSSAYTSESSASDLSLAGSAVFFGTYNDSDIEWVVLEVNDNDEALIISRNILNALPYNDTGSEITWEDSSIRSWLNNEFYNEAFTEEERSYIISSCSLNLPNAQYGISGGNNTMDNVFLLNIEEAQQYDFEALGVVNQVFYNTGACYGWWLRSPGQSGQLASYVDRDGNVCPGGLSATGVMGIHPAIRVSNISELIRTV